MTREELINGNKLIAEFMGYIETGKIHPFNPELGTTLKHPDLAGVTWGEKLRYHTSWDWLMPVVEKIDGMTYNQTQSISVSLSKTSCYIGVVKEYSITGETISNVKADDRIKATYKACIEFLAWYNTPK